MGAAYIVVWNVLVSTAFPSPVLAFFAKPIGVDIANIRFFSFSSIRRNPITNEGRRGHCRRPPPGG